MVLLTHVNRWGCALTLAMLLTMTAAAAQEEGGQGSTTLQAPPPAPFQDATELLPLPDFIPGAGSLYIDPEDAPVGPWLAYGQDGNLVEVLFMVPVSAMQEAQNWDDLAQGLISELGLVIDHVDITFNAGHPGMAEAHYHFRMSVVDPATQQEALNP